MTRKLFLYLVLAMTVGTACGTDTTKVTLKTFKPEDQHPAVFQTALQFISGYHYNKLRIDEEFSSKAFDNYFKHLDPSRVYFLESDIAEFNSFRSKIDDAVLGGDMTPAFDIYNRYQQRLKERIDFALARLKRDFDFNADESYRFDREKAPWCRDMSELNRLWEQKLKYECLLIRVTGKDSASYLETVRKRYENLVKFVQKTKTEDVFSLFVNSVTELADPHTNYFSPRIAEDFNQSMSLSLEGIGAQLQTDGEYTKVHTIIKGGPADRSKKIFANDKIIGVSQGKDSEMVNVIDWRIDDVVALIRGKKGTQVRLEILPVSDPNKPRVIELTRDKIVLEDQSAKSSVKEVIAGGKKLKIGVVSLPAFYIDFAAQSRGEANYKSTTRDVKKLIGDLKKQGIDGLVIDLRNNGGGSLQEAIELTGLFIRTGPVVQVKEASGNIKAEQDVNPELFYDGPLTVLVNRFSASASEIFAAAIQDYERGVVIGEKTFGKGTVQNLVDLNNFIHIDNKKVGQLKLTFAKFYRISGGSTQHKGVIPDINFPGVYDDDEFGEDASPFALPWDQIPATLYAPVGNISSIKTELAQRHDERMKTSAEYRYLMEDIAYLKKADARESVPLNEAKFKAESDEQDKLKKQREEERKVARQANADSGDLILTEGEMVIADWLRMRK